MKKIYLFLTVCFASMMINAQVKYYLCEQAGQPFNSPSCVNNMNTAFGTGNWTQAYFQTVNLNALLQPSVCFIYLEGSSTGANELNTFISANTSSLQNWVNAGGNLYINAAPNEGGSINLPFGAVLNYSTGPYNTTITAVPAQTNHAIFSVPATPAGTVFSGNFAAHGYITGAGLTALVTGTGGNVLCEMNSGSGKVMYGTIIPSSFMTPQPNGNNFKSNIISYAGNFCGGAGIAPNGTELGEIKIFPNPGNGLYRLVFNNGSEKQIQVFDISGREILNLRSEDDAVDLDLSKENSGLYFFRIKSNGFTQTIKAQKL